MRGRMLGLLLSALPPAVVAQPPGCNDARWEHWADLREQAHGWEPEIQILIETEQQNRDICAALQAGKITLEQADREQRETTKVMWRRLQAEKAKREERKGLQDAG